MTTFTCKYIANLPVSILLTYTCDYIDIHYIYLNLQLFQTICESKELAFKIVEDFKE